MFYVKIICVLLISTTSSIAQHSHGNHGDVGVRETGQAQFAAIAEIAEILRNDASTDWGKVNIQALRDHLVDMHNVTTGSTVAGTARTASRWGSVERAESSKLDE